MSNIIIDKLLFTVLNHKASELHITSGHPPAVRIDEHLHRLETQNLLPEDTMALMKTITPKRCQQELNEVGKSEFEFAFGDKARFHVSIFNQEGHVNMVLRQIPY
jgi:twitching motility protein PilT